MKIFERKVTETVHENGEREVESTIEFGIGSYILLLLFAVLAVCLFGGGFGVVLGACLIFAMLIIILFG